MYAFVFASQVRPCGNITGVICIEAIRSYGAGKAEVGRTSSEGSHQGPCTVPHHILGLLPGITP
jgi:hypothetical protein